jgi:outer membrane protein OmpA-like peptidoglycan-associated protein
MLQGPGRGILDLLLGMAPTPPPPVVSPESLLPVPEAGQGEEVVEQAQGRLVVRMGDELAIRNTDQQRFSYGAEEIDTVNLPDGNVLATITRPDGSQVITLYDPQGNIIRRVRREPDGREIVIIGLPPELDRDQDGYWDAPPPAYAEAPPVNVQEYNFDVYLPPLVVDIPQDQYIVEMQDATPEEIQTALLAPPVEDVERPYTLDEVLYSERIRDKVRRIDLDTITFDTGSWTVDLDQIATLEFIGYAIAEAIAANAYEVFLVEGHADAVGSDVSNLVLSDRRAESVATILTQYLGIPPENLITQGYGEEYLKIPTLGPERENRRVAFRRITDLLAGGPLY